MRKDALIAAFRRDFPNIVIGTLSGEKGSPVFVNNELEIPRFENWLARAFDSIIEEAKSVDIGQAPIKLMQDGQTMDFSFREGWNACKEKTRIALDGLKEVTNK